MILSDKQTELFIRKLVNDKSINDNLWETKYQHLRDDLCMENVNLEDLHNFHSYRHNINVKGLAKKYGVV